MLNQLKAAVNLASLVEKKFDLEGQGRYLKAKEHDSLVIDTKTQMYFWNSLKEQGDVIDWVGRHELNYNGQWSSLDPALFKEAVTWLAQNAGMEVKFKPEDAKARAERMTRQRLMDLATDYYQQRLNRDIQAYQYALERGLNAETIEESRLGYADGKLWQAIPTPDRPTAADMGLIVSQGPKCWDAIPSGYLVYAHMHHAKAEYLSGRAIFTNDQAKKSRNIKAPKRLFWVNKLGYGKPLVICEGQADALSLGQMGVNALALCGLNTADFDPDLVRLFSPIYIWQDHDAPGSAAASSWARRLAELVGLLGPTVRVIQAPAKDASDYLQQGRAAELDDLLAESQPYLDFEIERISQLKGADLYDQLAPLFAHLTALDIFQLNMYRSRVTKGLNISQGDFGRYLKAAKGTLSEDEESEFSKGGQYSLIDGWTVLKQFTDEGKHKLTPLANGSAKILEEVLKDDGGNDPSLDYVIGGELANGHKLPKIEIPAPEFPGLKWVSNWGSRFILSAGRSSGDHFRAAVQHLSGSPYRRTIYTHTGWRKVGEKMLYLTSSGALGETSDKIQVDLKLGRPDTNMSRYTLPHEPENVAEALQASLNFWHVADFSITVPIWGAMYLPPLMPFLMADFGLWVHGQTGSMKSSMVACALAHYGAWQGKEAKVFLPSNFQSTSNNILMNAFQAKDVPLVIDDFAPGATAREVKERDATASNLLRSIGNKAARGRMRDGRTFQADYPPRCLAIITAEDLPPTASIMARGIGVRVHIPPKGDPARRKIEQRLSAAQTEDSYAYPHAMAAYVLWVGRHWEQLSKDLPIMAAGYRDRISAAGHARLPDAFGKLMAAIDTALFFAVDAGAISEALASEKKAAAYDSMTGMLKEHGEAVDSVDACRIFQEILQENLDARAWYLVRTEAESTNPPINSPIGAILVGYEDDHFIYLLSKTVTDIMAQYQRLGAPFPVGRNTLYRRLIERGWLIPGDKASSTVFIPCLNTSPRVLKLSKKEVLPE